MVPSDFPRIGCAIGARVASALCMLTAAEAARRFGIGRTTALQLCRDHWPDLGAIRVPGGPGAAGWHWLIDPAALGLLLGDLDLAAAAERFGVAVETFAGLHPGRIGVLFALLPLPDRPRPQPHRPSPLSECEVGHAAQ